MGPSRRQGSQTIYDAPTASTSSPATAACGSRSPRRTSQGVAPSYVPGATRSRSRSSASARTITAPGHARARVDGRRRGLQPAPALPGRRLVATVNRPQGACRRRRPVPWRLVIGWPARGDERQGDLHLRAGLERRQHRRRRAAPPRCLRRRQHRFLRATSTSSPGPGQGFEPVEPRERDRRRPRPSRASTPSSSPTTRCPATRAASDSPAVRPSPSFTLPSQQPTIPGGSRSPTSTAIGSAGRVPGSYRPRNGTSPPSGQQVDDRHRHLAERRQRLRHLPVPGRERRGGLIGSHLRRDQQRAHRRRCPEPGRTSSTSTTGSPTTRSGRVASTSTGLPPGGAGAQTGAYTPEQAAAWVAALRDSSAAAATWC